MSEYKWSTYFSEGHLETLKTSSKQNLIEMQKAHAQLSTSKSLFHQQKKP